MTMDIYGGTMAEKPISYNRMVKKLQISATGTLNQENGLPNEQIKSPRPISMRFGIICAKSVKTDANGKASVDLKLPDNLTRYRVMAVSVDKGKRFGLGESNLTAKQPLMVRPSAPRFMNFGDKIELPVVVQNQTDKEMTVDVGVRATNAALTAGGGRKVTIEANDRAEVRFPVNADKAGIGAFPIRGDIRASFPTRRKLNYLFGHRRRPKRLRLTERRTKTARLFSRFRLRTMFSRNSAVWK